VLAPAAALPPPGRFAWRFVATASAFGNSVTLPLLLLAQLLPPAEAARAQGLCALYLLGWSPLLWSVGWRLLAPPGCDVRPISSEGPPLLTTAGTPVRPILLLPHPPLEGWRALAETLVARLRNRWQGLGILLKVKDSLNPPLVGILTGVAIGISPLAPYVLPASILPPHVAAAIALRTPPPLELAAFAAATRCAMDAAALLGDAALPVGTLVLATALGTPPSAAAIPSETAASLLAGGRRAELVAAAVRLVLLPCAWLALTATATHLKVPLPAVLRDPAVQLLLAAQAVVPSAQNIVLLLSLRRGTASAAPPAAALLLRQYVAAALPVAAWISVFSARIALGT